MTPEEKQKILNQLQQQANAMQDYNLTDML
jgi:hypothetical protein